LNETEIKETAVEKVETEPPKELATE